MTNQTEGRILLKPVKSFVIDDQFVNQVIQLNEKTREFTAKGLYANIIKVFLLRYAESSESANITPDDKQHG